ncbi:hypothetical protein DFQ28_000176 [Apophysomyces sp. BC1034]|nr:hypothetical protein DFQ30_000370 [Apophysomyces sp. BC1015]KAG0168250.1 hypothetical protein DFQ29_010222 [Apophysomyces sp. BC1021]KAG0184080.1 hypothetical protein DFQ28_000176 [Apophysomyces sp. BC1034]
MVSSLSLSFITQLRTALINRHASLSALISKAQRRIILKRKRSLEDSKALRVLYPRRLKKRLKSDDTFFNTVALAEVHIPTNKTSALSGLHSPLTPNYVAPRAPIVLCHGLYGFDKRGPDTFPFLQVHYWGGIEQALAKLGAKVIVTRVPSTGSIWERAQELHEILKTILENKEINFVAHSMGGLDCRYLLSHIKDRSYRARSLTTISTPHRGSPVMDWFRDHMGLGMADAIVTAAAKNMREQDPTTVPSSGWTLADLSRMPTSMLDPVVAKVIQLLDTPAYANLTTDYCQHYFNPNTPDDPNVAYYSYGAATDIPMWSFLGLPHQWIKEKEGENDGIVSVQSAKWGRYIKTLNADHWDLNGQRYRWRTSKPELAKGKFDPVDFYMELATFLYHQGH